jgi:hypothetical protein
MKRPGPITCKQDDDIKIVPVPMGRDTRARLRRFAEAVGRHPSQAAAALLDDLLLDDEAVNGDALN